MIIGHLESSERDGTQNQRSHFVVSNGDQQHVLAHFRRQQASELTALLLLVELSH